uniref:P3 protein n=2 Tax=Bursaphelenchus xylophilus TaxID=6326 RepID=A0A1I7SD61_BURXY
MGRLGKSCPMLLLIRLLIQFVSSTASSVQSYVSITYEPSVVHDLVEDHNKTVLININLNRRLYPNNYSKLHFELLPLHPDFFEADSYANELEVDEGQGNGDLITYKTTANLYGKMLGKSALQVVVQPIQEVARAENEFMQMSTSKMDVWVIRNPDKQYGTKVFVVTLIILITIANVLMGCELDMNVIWETLRKPVAPAIGFFTQFFLMPMISYVIASCILVPRGLNSYALGLFVCGCAPAGGASNFWTLLLDGNAHLSVTMTFLSMIASLVMMPLWMNLLGYKFLKGYSEDVVMRVPYTKIVMGLVAFIVPLLIGVLIARKRPGWAANARRILRPFVIFVLVFVIVFGTFSNLYMFELMNWPALISGLLLPWCGFMFGCFTAIFLRQKPEDVTAIAIETGVQNTGIAIMLLKFSFAEPDADISSLLPVIVACFTPGPLLVGFAVHSVIKWTKKRANSIVQDPEKPLENSVQGESHVQLIQSNESPGLD